MLPPMTIVKDKDMFACKGAYKGAYKRACKRGATVARGASFLNCPITSETRDSSR